MSPHPTPPTRFPQPHRCLSPPFTHFSSSSSKSDQLSNSKQLKAVKEFTGTLTWWTQRVGGRLSLSGDYGRNLNFSASLNVRRPAAGLLKMFKIKKRKGGMCQIFVRCSGLDCLISSRFSPSSPNPSERKVNLNRLKRNGQQEDIGEGNKEKSIKKERWRKSYMDG